jgi:hypothetical protein
MLKNVKNSGERWRRLFYEEMYRMATASNRKWVGLCGAWSAFLANREQHRDKLRRLSRKFKLSGPTSRKGKNSVTVRQGTTHVDGLIGYQPFHGIGAVCFLGNLGDSLEYKLFGIQFYVLNFRSLFYFKKK